MFIRTIIQQAAFSAAVLFLFFAILQIVPEKRWKYNYFLFFVFIDSSYLFLYYWLYNMKLLVHVPFLIFTEISSGLLIGPLLYFYYCSLTGSKEIVRRDIIIGIFPFLISLIVILVLNLNKEPIRFEYLESNSLFPEYSASGSLKIINIICDIYLAVYLILTAREMAILFRVKKKSVEIRTLKYFLSILGANGVLLIVSTSFENAVLIIMSIVIFACMPMYYIFFYFRYPDFSKLIVSESRKIRYERSVLLNVDIDIVKNRLIQLMEEEKIYINNEITLKSLSESLKITSHQLSQLLNDEMNVNFRTFINSYRIKDAKKALLEYPEKSVLQIAFSVGFNTKSVFNTYFSKECGESPTEYRKNRLKSQ